MPLPILALAAIGGIAATAFDSRVESHFDDIETATSENHIEDETPLLPAEGVEDEDQVTALAEEPFQPAFPLPPVPIKLRRGDRFICHETGQELQVRAMGGRPMHQPQDDFRYS